MAKENSFDVVSEVDMQEVDNAFHQTVKELQQRYDLKDSGSRIELDKHAPSFTIHAPSDFVARQIIDVLGGKLVKRGVDLHAVKWGAAEAASGGTVRITGTIVSGIDAELARKINKDVRDLKKKVKVQIEGEKLRVFSASRDELQDVIAFLKEQDYGIPLQYTNYR
jgi:hypothetical protein